MMIEITNKADCCGCSACASTCPVNCINMEEDVEGFLFPKIDNSKCVACGACERVCPILEAKGISDNLDATGSGTENSYTDCDIFEVPKAIGGWIKDDTIRYDSSSGGAFSLFANFVLAKGGVVFGAALCDDMVVRHISVENSDDLAKLRGSKYVQSDIGDSYRQIREHLDNGRMVLFSGTPCQAGGLHSFLKGKKYDKLFVIDFICHGVPSPRVFADYISYLEESKNDKITGFKFRLKDKNWSPTGLQLGTGISMSKGKFIRNYPAFKDPYMNGFLDDAYLRHSCYDCRFKSLPKYYSDITIADFWGVNKCYPELNDGKGTSLLLLNGKHGVKLFDATKDNFEYKEVEFDKAIRRNKSLIKSVKPNTRRAKFFSDYSKKSFKSMKLLYMNPFVWGFHRACGMAWNIIETIIRMILGPVLKKVNPNWSEANWKSLFQFVKFAMVGVSNVVVSYSINVLTLLLQHFLVPGFEYDYVVANITAFVLSVLWSYHWNSRKVFDGGQTKGEKFRSLLRSYESYAFSGIILNNLLSTFWIRILGISKFISPLLNIPITMPINFLILKKWAFKKKK